MSSKNCIRGYLASLILGCDFSVKLYWPIFKAPIYWYHMADLDEISVSSLENNSRNASLIYRKMKGLDQNKAMPKFHLANAEREDDKDVDQLFNNMTMDTSWKVCYGTTTIILSFLLFLWFYFEKFGNCKFYPWMKLIDLKRIFFVLENVKNYNLIAINEFPKINYQQTCSILICIIQNYAKNTEIRQRIYF